VGREFEARGQNTPYPHHYTLCVSLWLSLASLIISSTRAMIEEVSVVLFSSGHGVWYKMGQCVYEVSPLMSLQSKRFTRTRDRFPALKNAILFGFQFVLLCCVIMTLPKEVVRINEVTPSWKNVDHCALAKLLKHHLELQIVS